MRITIRLDQEQLEKMATGSLSGMIMEKAGGEQPTEVLLEFSQTSLQWRMNNGGPDHIIVPEYTIPELLKSMIFLIESGIKFRVVMSDVR